MERLRRKVEPFLLLVLNAFPVFLADNPSLNDTKQLYYLMFFSLGELELIAKIKRWANLFLEYFCLLFFYPNVAEYAFGVAHYQLLFFNRPYFHNRL